MTDERETDKHNEEFLTSTKKYFGSLMKSWFWVSFALFISIFLIVSSYYSLVSSLISIKAIDSTHLIKFYIISAVAFIVVCIICFTYSLYKGWEKRKKDEKEKLSVNITANKKVLTDTEFFGQPYDKQLEIITSEIQDHCFSKEDCIGRLQDYHTKMLYAFRHTFNESLFGGPLILPYDEAGNELIENAENTAKNVFVISWNLNLDLEDKREENGEQVGLYYSVHNNIKEWKATFEEWRSEYEECYNGNYTEYNSFESRKNIAPYRYIVPRSLMVEHGRVDQYIKEHVNTGDKKLIASYKRALFLAIDDEFFGIFGPNPERTLHCMEGDDGKFQLITFLNTNTDQNNGRAPAVKHNEGESKKYYDDFQKFWDRHKNPIKSMENNSVICPRLPLNDVAEVLEIRATKVWVISPDLGVDLKVESFNRIIEHKLKNIAIDATQEKSVYRYILPDTIEVEDWDNAPEDSVVKQYCAKYNLDYNRISQFFCFAPIEELESIRFCSEMTYYQVPKWVEMEGKKDCDLLTVFLPKQLGQKEDSSNTEYAEFVQFLSDEKCKSFIKSFKKIWDTYSKFKKDGNLG